MDRTAPPALTELVKHLSRRPPSLSNMVLMLSYSRYYRQCVDLIETYLPDEAADLAEIPKISLRVQRFSVLFSERYFPIYARHFDEWEDEFGEPAFAMLCDSIPFELYGISYEDLHELWGIQEPAQACIGLLSKPGGELTSFFGSEVMGMRVSWLESASEHIPTETLERIPPAGIAAEVLADATKGTRFAAAGGHALWLWSQTDNFFLDYSYGDEIEVNDPWDRDTVDYATQNWRKAKKVIDAVDALADWLAVDLPARFAEMLDEVLPRVMERSKVV